MLYNKYIPNVVLNEDTTNVEGAIVNLRNVDRIF